VSARTETVPTVTTVGTNPPSVAAWRFPVVRTKTIGSTKPTVSPANAAVSAVRCQNNIATTTNPSIANHDPTALNRAVRLGAATAIRSALVLIPRTPIRSIHTCFSGEFDAQRGDEVVRDVRGTRQQLGISVGVRQREQPEEDDADETDRDDGTGQGHQGCSGGGVWNDRTRGDPETDSSDSHHDQCSGEEQQPASCLLTASCSVDTLEEILTPEEREHTDEEVYHEKLDQKRRRIEMGGRERIDERRPLRQDHEHR